MNPMEVIVMYQARRTTVYRSQLVLLSVVVVVVVVLFVFNRKAVTKIKQTRWNLHYYTLYI